ncbi:MAG: hypothetical protein ABJC05_06190 [Pyrinomonadaceae bacterium]
MKSEGTVIGILLVILRTALPVALLVAGWSVYRKLPAQIPEAGSDSRLAPATSLQIVLRQPANYQGRLDVPVNLYPVDVSAAQREYLAKPHAGTSFEDFLLRRMNGRSSVKTRLDKLGQATVNVPEGNWWLVAQLSADNEIEWRLPITVAGRKQSIELTAENAYGRTKVF